MTQPVLGRGLSYDCLNVTVSLGISFSTPPRAAWQFAKCAATYLKSEIAASLPGAVMS